MSRPFRYLDLRPAFPGLLGLAPLPTGYVYLTDDNGVFLTDDNGAFLVVAL